MTVHHPIVAERGDLTLALYGSFLPVPAARVGAAAVAARCARRATCTARRRRSDAERGARDTCTLTVINRGDRPIQVGSHYHFIETNRALEFDRAAAYGMRLDIPAGTAVRFEPGETKTVTLVAIAGARVIRGGNALADGPVTDEGRDRAGSSGRATGGSATVRSSDEPPHRSAPLRRHLRPDHRRSGPARRHQPHRRSRARRDRLRRRVQVRRRQGAARRHGAGGRRDRRARARLRDHQRADRRLDRHPQGGRRHQGRADRRHRQGRQSGRDGGRDRRAWSSASRPRRSPARA